MKKAVTAGDIAGRGLGLCPMGIALALLDVQTNCIQLCNKIANSIERERP